jgi:hypothetical protein
LLTADSQDLPVLLLQFLDPPIHFAKKHRELQAPDDEKHRE